MAASKTKQVAAPAPVTGRTSDAGDPNVAWTVQSAKPFANTDAIPGQIFVPAQLPVAELQRAAGIEPSVANAGLVVLTEAEAKGHPGGPEADDRLTGTAVYEGTDNAAARTAPNADNAPAVASTVDNVPA